jgi:hypothetical protein
LKELDKPFNRSDFDNSIIKFSKKFGEGIVDEYFVDMVNKFDYSKNTKSVTSSILKFIEKTNSIN